MALDFREVESQYHGRLNEPSSDFIWGDFIDESICDELIHFYDTQDIILRGNTDVLVVRDQMVI